MPKTLSKILTRRLLESMRFRDQLNDLHILSGMEVHFLDPLGNERIRAPREHTHPFYRLTRIYPELETEQRGIRQRTLGGEGGPDSGPEPWFEISRPLSIEGECVGYLLMSACRPVETGIAPIRSLWLRMAGKGSTLPWPNLRQAWEKLPEMDKTRREAWARNLELQGREAMRRYEKREESMLKTSDRLPPMILRVCEAVHARYMDPLTLRELAGEQLVSVEHLSRVFHQSTGLRFREYLAEVRIQAAREALRESTDLISEIAGRCGFSTLSRFNRCFRELTGTTPREFRKRGVAT